jgi:hypothetical protein
MKYWEIIADNLTKAGFSVGWVSAVDSVGQMIWIVDAQRGDGNRFIVRSDEKLSAFVELERQALTVTFYLESTRAGDPITVIEIKPLSTLSPRSQIVRANAEIDRFRYA